jgi:hypothetical protein
MPSNSQPPPLPGSGLDVDHNLWGDTERFFPSALISDLYERECEHRCINAFFPLLIDC